MSVGVARSIRGVTCGAFAPRPSRKGEHRHLRDVSREDPTGWRPGARAKRSSRIEIEILPDVVVQVFAAAHRQRPILIAGHGDRHGDAAERALGAQPKSNRYVPSDALVAVRLIDEMSAPLSGCPAWASAMLPYTPLHPAACTRRSVWLTPIRTRGLTAVDAVDPDVIFAGYQ